ncbi:PspC domain-containing protein, partial [Candidatus Falkowbacteria bacterium]|nr:PspC domain-containing protein [Candidatus Falkowbacteria bacterium]
MNKVISINLGGRAYQVEEAGYGKLQDYLKQAAERLDNDPDKGEILDDLEQALAEKLNRRLSSGKTVVSTREVEEIIREMGPVDGGSERSGSDADEKKGEALIKRLHRIKEGKVIGGVCTGLAAYFDVDVVLVRFIFVALVFLTSGAWIFVYLVMMLVIPKARTSEQLAAAYGEPYTAQDLIRRAREEFREFSNKSEWKKWKHEMRQKMRQHRREWSVDKNSYEDSGFMGLIILAFIIAWVVGLASIVSKGAVFGIVLPVTWPLWAVVVGWVLLFPL